ncbi:molybdopterin-dependent oxidoreductase [Defluviimonas sp. WL0002]|uniref:Molybdopterin-dependent oxidoreductase n=1 Tax=Albidovulum marisflavi TaxID=2984159 RepID=A0ABT2ZB44_9RHOB|nr:molybdopterin-dependent oxidoreductase [Defluviimonas sp. WL0002]MCV2868252.1 molybdopterin-dependent oxidoreductase [Defluviimonas sp. WL0002]
MSGDRGQVTSAHWGASRVFTEGGRIVRAEPFEEDPDPSPIAHILPKAVHHADRVARPSVRKGWLKGDRARGSGHDDFVEMPWDEALDIAAEEIGRIRRVHGNEAIYGGSYGWSSAGRFHHAQSQLHRFLNCIGGYVARQGSYSLSAAEVMIPHIFGVSESEFHYSYQERWSEIVEHTETLVAFGGINTKNAQVNPGGTGAHRTGAYLRAFGAGRGVMFNVSPQRGDSPEFARWIPVIPGTDTALILALAHELERTGRVDRDFLSRCAVGYDRFRAYLAGETDGVAKNVAWASAISGVPAEEIVALADRMATTRTMVAVSWSVQRAENGEQPYWAAATLAAMLGQIGLPGGGFGEGYGTTDGGGTGPTRRWGGGALPQGTNPVGIAIPVARIADMLLNPGMPYQYNGQNRTYPDIRLIMWAGGNPYHHHQDLRRLERAWEKPDCVIVNEPWWTATARRADIVFPATTPYEREDFGRESTDPYIFHMPRLIEPLGEARDDFEIFRGLAARLGAEEAFTEGLSATEWIARLYGDFRAHSAGQGVATPALDDLKARNWAKIDPPPQPAEGPLAAFRRDPEAHPLQTPSGRIEVFSDTIAAMGYGHCPGHAVWIEPTEWLGTRDRYRLHMLSPQPADKLHSQLEAALADEPDARPMRVVLNPEEARSRGIADGTLVEVFNDRGTCLARARISDDVMPGVLILPTGAWYRPDGQGRDTQGNPNVLTRDIGTSPIAQGPTAHTTLVDLRPV